MTEGSLQPVSRVVLALWAIVGLVVGWLFHPISDRWGTPPLVTWTQPLALIFVAGVLAYVAYTTWRTLQRQGGRLPSHQAVNRLVLGRACALVGSFVAGGYLGYALSWLGNSAELADQRIGRSLLAALGAGLMVLSALLLERACRVRSDDEES